MKKVNRREFVTAAAMAGAGAVLPAVPVSASRKHGMWASSSSAPALVGREVVALQARPFPMQNVRLLEGPLSAAAAANRKYLKTLAPDRLLHTFRLTAGFPSSAEPLGEWEKPDCELRGHFAGGHYLSACALAFASSGDEELKRNGDLMVSELAKCQAQSKNGYLSAFPVEWFDRLRDGVNVWAPFYTYHKIMAGISICTRLRATSRRLSTVEKMAGWVRSWADPLSEQQMQRVLQVEYGGMGEVLANLYAVTGKQEYLRLAQRFDKKSFFDPLAAHRDELKGLHVNTHIPQVIAAARLYEMTGDKRYWNIADYFWNEVTSERAYCTGGISNFEFWQNGSWRAVDPTQRRHGGGLLRIQHDEADAASVRLVTAAAIHGLLRTPSVQSPHGNHRSGNRNNGLFSAGWRWLLQDLCQAFRFILVLQRHRSRRVCQADGLHLLPRRQLHLRQPLCRL